MSKKGKKELEEQFAKLIEDILDHYEEYVNDDKQKVKTLLDDLIKLNEYLNKYDEEPEDTSRIKKRPKWLLKLKEGYENFFR